MSRMSIAASVLALVSLAACARPNVTPAPAAPCCAEVGRLVAEQYHVAAISSRRFTHDGLWEALGPVVRVPALRTTEIGRSIQGRPIRAVTFGAGPTTVMLWSQMHGDESTATMALADLLAWLGTSSDVGRDVHARLATRLTIVMVPMLNPDGAELFQRENAVGVDINRDAATLATPEARALKALRDSLRPAFGFNLHDQNARTLTGRGGRQVAISLLAPAADERETFDGARGTARLVASGIASVLEPAIPGRVARYDEGFNRRAFGDNMQHWGTATVLIESGGLPDDPEKQRLRTLNVVGILSALDAIATERWRSADSRVYDALPLNDRAGVDVLVRGARVVLPGVPPLRVDLALNYEDPVLRVRPRVREVGDLSGVAAIDTLDAAGLFLHPAPSMLTERNGQRWLRIGAPAAFTLRRGPEATSDSVRALAER